jgi:predicted nucleic acid-binding protein
VRFWDSSAIVPLVVPERSSTVLRRLYRDDPVLVAWWGTELECVSAIVRRQREGDLPAAVAQGAFDRLSLLRRSWQEVEPADDLRESARRFLRVHPLRVADALQRAAAFRAAESRPATLPFVSLDDRLTAAARNEGFPIAIA